MRKIPEQLRRHFRDWRRPFITLHPKNKPGTYLVVSFEPCDHYWLCRHCRRLVTPHSPGAYSHLRMHLRQLGSRRNG